MAKAAKAPAPTAGLPSFATAVAAGKPAAGPNGSRMQSWYVDNKERRVRTPEPVPVDADDHRTAHLKYGCPSKGCGHFEWLLPKAKRHCPEHGTQIVARAGAAVQRSVLLGEARRLHGASAAPWVVLLATGAAGAVLRLAHTPVSDVVIASPVVVAGAYLGTRWQTTRRARKDGMEKGEREGRHARRIRRFSRTAALIAGAATTWVTMAAGADMHTWPVVATSLPVVWALSSYPYWLRADRRRRAGLAPTTAIPEPAAAAAVVDQLEAGAVAAWARDIARDGGPLPGTHLVDFKRLPACAAGGPDRPRRPNWTATVVAKPGGSVNMRKTRPDLLGAIAAAYGLSEADVSFAPDEHDNSRAYVRVCPDNYLAEVRMWPGPGHTDWTTGVSTIGRFDDGEPIRFIWYNEIGACHALLSGASGSGKSEVIARLLLDALHSGGRVLNWVGDPQRGQSYGELQHLVDWFASGLTEIKLMLLAAKLEMFRRNDVLSRAYAKTWKLTPDMPLLVITLDEVQSYAEDPDIQKLLFDLAGMSRKTGIAIHCITQVPAAYAFGTNIYVKEQITMQRLIFRASTGQAGTHATEEGVMFAPTNLPMRWGPGTCGAGLTTAGLMYLMGPYGRDVFGRTDFTGETMRPWLFDDAGELTTSPGVFGDDAQQVSGVLWGLRRERGAAAAQAGLDPNDLLPDGKALPLFQLAEMLQHGPVDDVAAVLNSSTKREPTARNQVHDAAVANADADGVVTKEQIVKATPGMNTNTRSKAITDLIGDGAFERSGGGKVGAYRVPAAITAG